MSYGLDIPDDIPGENTVNTVVTEAVETATASSPEPTETISSVTILAESASIVAKENLQDYLNNLRKLPENTPTVKRRGRKPLSEDDNGKSPRIGVAVTQALYTKLTEDSKQTDGGNISITVRRILAAHYSITE